MTGLRRWSGWRAAALVTLALSLPVPALGNGWEHGAIPFEALLRALGFENPETWRRAAESLGHRGQKEAVGPLLDRLRLPEPNPHVRSAVYLALGRLGDARAVAALTRCLDTESREELRGDCALALGLLRAAGAVPRLLEALRDDPSSLVRSRAVDALGSFGEPAAVAALTSLVTADSQPQLRLRAVQALGRTGAAAAAKPVLTVLGRARDDAERGAAVEALTVLKPRDAARPLAALLEATGDPELRARIVVALGAIRDGDTLPSLVRALGDGSQAVRYFAVEGLRAIGRPGAAAPLTALSLEISRRLRARSVASLVADADRVIGDLSVQEAALRALAELNAAAGLPALLLAAESRAVPPDSAEALRMREGFFEVRRTALVGLGYTRSPRAVALLAGRHGADDPDFRLRASAVRALGVLGAPGAAARVTAALGDPAAEVRWTAAAVLGRLGQRAAVDPLLRRLADPHAEVRREAALSLGYLGDPRAAGALRALARRDERESVREAAAYAATLVTR